MATRAASMRRWRANAGARRDPERAIGSAIIDQEVLSGIGNVYKSEVLFITETSPFARVVDLDDANPLARSSYYCPECQPLPRSSHAPRD